MLSQLHHVLPLYVIGGHKMLPFCFYCRNYMSNIVIFVSVCIALRRVAKLECTVYCDGVAGNHACGSSQIYCYHGAAMWCNRNFLQGIRIKCQECVSYVWNRAQAGYGVQVSTQ